MVKRECNECEEIFHPYGPDDYICDSCLEALGYIQCTVCGFDFKPDEDSSGDICTNCLIDLEADSGLVS